MGRYVSRYADSGPTRPPVRTVHLIDTSRPAPVDTQAAREAEYEHIANRIVRED